MTDEPFTDMYELLDAIEAVIKASDPAKREALASTLDAFAEDCPGDFFWAIGPQAPAFLNLLLMMIDGATREQGESKSRVIRLVDRKPEEGA
jgi:hypothetical protein